MNAEIKQRWLAALRSGQYKQGQGVLRTPNDEYCCLGILCDLIAPEQWGTLPIPTPSGDGGMRECIMHDGHNRLPDVSILALAELDESDAIYLAGINDEGTPFDEIAAYGERAL